MGDNDSHMPGRRVEEQKSTKPAKTQTMDAERRFGGMGSALGKR